MDFYISLKYFSNTIFTACSTSFKPFKIVFTFKMLISTMRSCVVFKPVVSKSKKAIGRFRFSSINSKKINLTCKDSRNNFTFVRFFKFKDMMEENEMKNEKEDLFSKAVRAGKRTYFFDVKTTKNDEKYLTITESKRRFDNDQNRFFFEKHKIFLYKEDFEKVSKALNDAINFIETGEYPEDYNEEPAPTNEDGLDKWFDDLDKNL